MVHCIFLGVSGYNFFKILHFFGLNIFFTITNNVFTVCKSTRLGVSSIQRVKGDLFSSASALKINFIKQRAQV